MISILRSMWLTFLHVFHKTETVEYPEVKPYLAPRYRGRIVLTGMLRRMKDVLRVIFVQLFVRLIVFHCKLQKVKHGRRYPEFFRINFSRCIFCGFCEEACPTYAIQLIPDFEMGEYDRQNMVYEKEHLLISGEGKYPGYNFYKHAGVDMGVKGKGEGDNEEKPVDVKDLMP